MANEEHLKILKEGASVWFEWRLKNRAVTPNFGYADLHGVDLRQMNLHEADFRRANLSGANLSGANLYNSTLIDTDMRDADLSGTDLRGADLSGANLNNADLKRSNLLFSSLIDSKLCHTQLVGVNLTLANLTRAQLRKADLSGADIGRAILSHTDLDGAILRSAHLINSLVADTNVNEADLSYASIGYTSFVNIDLQGVKGLETVVHSGPSEISISTMYRSAGHIPDMFLRGCGVPDALISQIPALIAAIQPIQFYSCFISYSGKDEEFAKRLHSRMREADLQVWFAPEDIKGGDKIYDQIDRAIQYHDRLLLVLSKESLRSKWVELEIKRARKVELKEGRRKLFPIRLTSYEALQEWVSIDSITGEDLAEEVRSYFIPDFSNWKSHDDFERSFARLYADLKASTE